MQQPTRDPRLAAVIQVQIATACLNEAAIRLTDLLRARTEPPAPDWLRAYGDACSYLVRAHKRYAAYAQILSRRAESAPELIGHLASIPAEMGMLVA